MFITCTYVQCLLLLSRLHAVQFRALLHVAQIEAKLPSCFHPGLGKDIGASDQQSRPGSVGKKDWPLHLRRTMVLTDKQRERNNTLQPFKSVTVPTCGQHGPQGHLCGSIWIVGELLEPEGAIGVRMYGQCEHHPTLSKAVHRDPEVTLRMNALGKQLAGPSKCLRWGSCTD
jgi:hypothetical protein